MHPNTIHVGLFTPTIFALVAMFSVCTVGSGGVHVYYLLQECCYERLYKCIQQEHYFVDDQL